MFQRDCPPWLWLSSGITVSSKEQEERKVKAPSTFVPNVPVYDVYVDGINRGSYSDVAKLFGVTPAYISKSLSRGTKLRGHKLERVKR